MDPNEAVVAARFWKRVDSSATRGCWPYRGATFPKGYGQVKALGERMAHRLAYRLAVGPIAAGLEIDHLCRNRLCVRPDHLEAVTPEENMRRARRTHCSRGHEFTPENVTLRADGRSCRTCDRIRKRAWHVAHYVDAA